MGFFNKLVGTAAVVGATVGSVLYVKNRKETRKDDEVFEDLSGEKYFDYETTDDKIKLTFNTKKAKQTADQVADKIIDKYDETVEQVTEKIGEENADMIKENYEATKAKVKETALRVSSVANDAKKKAIDVIGEENVKEAKEKVKDTVNDAKDAIKDKVNPSTEDFDDFDKPASNPEPATTEEVDIPKVKKDEGIDFMEDELSDL
ncbi:MAG: hypothetical protein IKF24_02280 [Eubacterium sp.]|nr:hypothetical protein [Eubacterium sp.]